MGCEAGMEPSVRKASVKDSGAFLDLLVGLANFEHLEPPNGAAKRRILDDIFQKKRATLLLATLRGKTVGYALYFFAYSSFLARPTLYLEDIFVLEACRGKGVGLALFLACAKEAARQKCGRMEWSVLTWNSKAIEFYEHLGAKRLDEWYVYRLSSEGVARLAHDGIPP
jgi:GNAT superfamily N-acetyltransferase